MFKQVKRAALGLALAATTMAMAAPAEARDRYGRHHGDGGEDAAIAIGAGIVGLAIGAAIADRDDDRYYDDGYYRHRRYVRVSGYSDPYYYYDANPNRYYRDRHYSRHYYPKYRSHYRYRDHHSWDRGYYGGRRYNSYYGGRHYRHGGKHYNRNYRRHGW